MLPDMGMGQHRGQHWHDGLRAGAALAGYALSQPLLRVWYCSAAALLTILLLLAETVIGGDFGLGAAFMPRQRRAE